MNTIAPRPERAPGKGRRLAVAVATALALATTGGPGAVRAAGQTVPATMGDYKRLGQLQVRMISVDYDRTTPGPAARVTVTFALRNSGIVPAVLLPRIITGHVSGRPGEAGAHDSQTVIDGRSGGLTIRPRQEVRGTMQFLVARDQIDALNGWAISWEGEGRSARTRVGYATFDLPRPSPAPASNSGGAADQRPDQGATPAPAPVPTPTPTPAPTPAPAPAPQPIPSPAPAEQGIKFANAFQTIKDWSVRLDDLALRPSGYNSPIRGHAVLTVTIRNTSGGRVMLSGRSFRAVLVGGSKTHSCFNAARIISPTTTSGIEAQTLSARDELALQFICPVSVADQAGLSTAGIVELDPLGTRDLGSTNFDIARNRPAPTSAPTGPAAATGESAAERLKTYEGRYRTNRGTILTLRVEGNELVGESMTEVRPSPREQVKLTLREDGSVRGSLRDEHRAGAFTWYDLNIRFTPDGTKFAGTGAYTHAASNPPISFSGTRIGGASAAQGATAQQASGFTEAGYLALRPEAFRRSQDQWRAHRAEITLSARNPHGDRRSLQHNDNRFVLVTADGVEHPSDGNFYGQTGADHLKETVWVEGDEQATVTYVFAGVQPSAAPARLIVRDSVSRQQLGVFDVSRLGATSANAGSDAGGEGLASGPITLDRYQVTLEKVEQGADGQWQSVMSLKNNGQAPLRVLINDLTVVLYGADGQARHANGNFYMPDAARLTPLRDAGILAPGQSIRVRRVHPQSATITPLRFRVQEGSASGMTGVTARRGGAAPEN